MLMRMVGGRGEYGNPRVQDRLWRFFGTPNHQNSILIYLDGSVVEKPYPSNLEVSDPSVAYVIYGGSQVVLEDDSFEYLSLLATGDYFWNEVPPEGTYTELYEDVY